MKRKTIVAAAVLSGGAVLLLTAAAGYFFGMRAGRAQAAAWVHDAAEQQTREIARVNGWRLELAIRALRGERSAADALRREQPVALQASCFRIKLPTLENYDAEFVRWLGARVDAAAANPAERAELAARLAAGREFLARWTALPPLPPPAAFAAPAAAEEPDIERKLQDARSLLDFSNPPPEMFADPLSR